MSKSKRKKNRGLRFLVALIVILLVISVAGVWFLNTKNLSANFTPADYSASNEQLNNPYCGWFHTYKYEISDEMEFDVRTVSKLVEEDNNTRMCQLDFDLSAYAAGQVSEVGIGKIETILNTWKLTNKKILVSFSYHEKPENIATVYLHIEQMANLINENTDCIYGLRGAFLGADEIDVQQRNELFDYERSLVSDGVLIFSEERLGEETTISDIKKLALPYLDADDNATLVEKWRNETYRGDDVFSGVTTYDYIASHLGYRYRVTSAGVSYNPWESENATIEIAIGNEGFLSTRDQFDATVLLKNKETEEMISVPLDCDIRKIKPNMVKKIKSNVDVGKMEKGNYIVYFIMIDAKSGEVIHLGNTMPLTPNGYQIGTLQLQ